MPCWAALWSTTTAQKPPLPTRRRSSCHHAIPTHGGQEPGPCGPAEAILPPPRRPHPTLQQRCLACPSASADAPLRSAPPQTCLATPAQPGPAVLRRPRPGRLDRCATRVGRERWAPRRGEGPEGGACDKPLPRAPPPPRRPGLRAAAGAGAGWAAPPGGGPGSAGGKSEPGPGGGGAGKGICPGRTESGRGGRLGGRRGLREAGGRGCGCPGPRAPRLGSVSPPPPIPPPPPRAPGPPPGFQRSGAGAGRGARGLQPRRLPGLGSPGLRRHWGPIAQLQVPPTPPVGTGDRSLLDLRRGLGSWRSGRKWGINRLAVTMGTGACPGKRRTHLLWHRFVQVFAVPRSPGTTRWATRSHVILGVQARTGLRAQSHRMPDSPRNQLRELGGGV